MLSGLLAPCMRHVRQPYAAGFLQRSRLRFDMAVHWGALCFVTLGNGMLNSAEYVDRGEEGKGRCILRAYLVKTKLCVCFGDGLVW